MITHGYIMRRLSERGYDCRCGYHPERSLGFETGGTDPDREELPEVYVRVLTRALSDTDVCAEGLVTCREDLERLIEAAETQDTACWIEANGERRFKRGAR
jgi:hypothetical protein